jgi:hypothetical protein
MFQAQKDHGRLQVQVDPQNMFQLGVVLSQQSPASYKQEAVFNMESQISSPIQVVHILEQDVQVPPCTE